MFLTVFLVVVLIQYSSAAECTPGETKRIDCNNCSCTPTGIWACSRRTCPSKRAAKCTPGESYKVDCNTCVCGKDGETSACTLRVCAH
ncbi:Pacifastin inhibitor (LCMII) [Popillia japonica]|uniref:Pacifastin inhibitor (LCMII) n=1 Tax=Popillia japonica TaxID=7064 RepID=A0AAW1MCI2_POPJA